MNSSNRFRNPRRAQKTKVPTVKHRIIAKTSASGAAAIRIREFDLADYHLVFELWRVAGLEIRPGDKLEDVMLKVQRDPDLFLVAEEENRIIGTVMGAWDGRRGWIYHLAVDPDHQRKGIGASLLKTVEKRLAAKGALRVNAQVQSSNEKSLEFFKAVGYEPRPDLIMIGKMLSVS